MSIFETVKEILKEDYGIDDLDMSMSIRKDLGLSSFELAAFLCTIEERCGTGVSLEAFADTVTVGDFVHRLEETVKQESDKGSV